MSTDHSEKKGRKMRNDELEVHSYIQGGTSHVGGNVKGMYPAPHIHEHLRYTNCYGKLRTSSRTT